MAEASDLSQHINVFNQVIGDLKRLDVKFKDKDKVLMLLISLPTSNMYNNLVTTLTWGKESLGLEDVKRALLAFHQSKKVSDENSQGEGLLVKGNQKRGRSNNKGGSSSRSFQSKYKRRKDVNCYKCRKRGHMKRDCPNLKKKDDEKEGSSRSTNVVEDDSDVVDGDMLSVASTSEHLVNSWLLDSSCSFYVTSNRGWFDTYRSVNSGIVTMGNGAHCTITGIGNIKIRMFEGVVRALCDVRHVQEVEKNLISLGTLDSNGFCFKSEGRVMKVVKGAMVVMKGEKNSKSTYKLLGNTVVGEAASVESECDDTVLWHMCMGHMGERGMLELHMRNLLKGVKTCKLEFCKFCVIGKQSRVQFKSTTHKIDGVLDYIHSDVWGPVRTASQGGNIYISDFY
jgi:hypothetical protein